MKQFRIRYISWGLVSMFLLLCAAAPLTFTSCDNEEPEIDVTLTSDYSGIIAAINNVNSTLMEKLATIQSAVDGGTLDNKEVLELIQQALEAMNGTLDEKLGDIKDAITSQTTSLEMKLDLIYGALNTGLTDANGALGLIKDALLSLKDSVSGDEGLIKKIGEIVASLGDIDTTLTDDVVKALQDILGAMPTVPDYSDLLEAIEKAIEEIGGKGDSASDYKTVAMGEDLQKAINEAGSAKEIRVQAGALISGPIELHDNLKISGGWTEGFTKQDLTNKSIIDGGNTDLCVRANASDGENVISGFEIRNGAKSGILLSGKLTVEYCWIHNCFNSGQGGAICSTEQVGDELLLANSVIEYNKADAHGGAIAINGTGTKLTMVNCLVRGNASIAQYGYTGAIHGQAGVQAYLVNNTIVNNVNWRDGSEATASPWSAVMFRNSTTHIEMVNNIVAGNYYFLPGVASDASNTDRYDMPIKMKYILELQDYSIDLNEIGASDLNYVCRNNVLAGEYSERFISRAGSDTAREAAQAACTFVYRNEYSKIFKYAEAGDFRPSYSGPAFAAGENSEYVKGLLGIYTTDLTGKSYPAEGAIAAGCYQQ